MPAGVGGFISFHIGGVKRSRYFTMTEGHYFTSSVSEIFHSKDRDISPGFFTSIGANIHEANYAQSKADFVAKLQIALKECYETEYWLELFVKSDFLDRDIAKKVYTDCGTIRRILISSINTTKNGTK